MKIHCLAILGLVTILSTTLQGVPALSGGGVMTVSPTTNTTPGTSTNVFKFLFRAEASGDWLLGAQVKLTVPAGWTEPQTNLVNGPGYVAAKLNSGTSVSIVSIGGTGPWDVTLNYQGTAGTTKGFDLSYTNVTVPVETGLYTFVAATAQAGSTFTNLSVSPTVNVITRQNQVIDFPSIPYALTPSMILGATASSGLPVTHTVVSGPATVSGSNLSFTATGTVTIATVQAGNIAWYPAVPVTNTFRVFAGGVMTLSPAMAMAGSSDYFLKFSFRGDGQGTWAAGSQVRITIPASWPQPQTSSSTGPGYVTVKSISATALSIDSITGTGPWDINVNYQGTEATARGFDLSYTNLVMPAPGVYAFETACRQYGSVYTNTALNKTIELVEGSDQTITFPAIENQIIENVVTLNATASSGLPITYTLTRGAGTLGSGTLNLNNVNSTGLISVVASQTGNAYYREALPITNSFMCFAGGTLGLTPATVQAGVATNILKFSFRGDGLGAWQIGSQIHITIPAGWTQPQTNSTASPGFLRVNSINSQLVSLADLSGNGPWDVTLNYSGGYATTKGFDLIYSNAAPPLINADYTFDPVCVQYGYTFTNPALAPSIQAVVRTNQSIIFPSIGTQFTTNKVVLNATASSGLPVSYTISGPVSVSGVSNLSFTAMGMATVIVSQAGALYWAPAAPVTNIFMVYAGASLSLTPDAVTGCTSNNILTFSFRGDTIAAWPAGSQIRIIIPEGWSPPQTNSPSSPGFMKLASVSATALSFGSISGTGPWDVWVNYQGTDDKTRGFNLTYSNAVSPSVAGLYQFDTSCHQPGYDYVNPLMNQSIRVVEGHVQTIDFPAIDHQAATNKVVLNATASSGLPVAYTIQSIPAGIVNVASVSNLTFDGTGTVTIVAAQAGTLDWFPAPSITNAFVVYAGGSIKVIPAQARAGSITNTFVFEFRHDGLSYWAKGSQFILTVPSGWTAPQTNSATEPGYISAATEGTGGTISLADITGTGSWNVVVNYSGGVLIGKGFNLTYRNVTAPETAGDHPFDASCLQYGLSLTNQSLKTRITLIQGVDQAITFPVINEQIATNKVVLRATASSGLPVSYQVNSEPASFVTITTVSNLTFTGTGVVSVVALQAGSLSNNPAMPITNTFLVTPGLLTPVANAGNKVYNGTTIASVSGRSVIGKAAGDDVGLTGGTGAFADKHVGTGKLVTITGFTLTGSDVARYALATNTIYDIANITARGLTVSAVSDTNKIYNGLTDSAVSPTSGTLVGGDTAEWIQVFEDKHAGIDKRLIPSGTVYDGNGGTNYSLTFLEVSNGVILRRDLTVTGAQALDKVYDGTTAAVITNAVLMGVIGDDEVTLVSTTGSFAQADPGESIAVTASLTITGASALNYSLIQPVGLAAAILASEPFAITLGECVTDPVCGNAFRLSWKGMQTCAYSVEYTDSLSSPDWKPVPGCIGIAGSNGVIRATDTNVVQGCRFYRIKMRITP